MLGNIDDDLIREIIQPDQYNKIGKEAPIKGIVKLKIVDYDTEVDIPNRRTADILVTVHSRSDKFRLVIEVENDRKFDVGEILRKLKKSRRHPTIVIIPKKFKRDAFRFQKSGFYVWYWSATCRWRCRKCNEITKTTSTKTPNKCATDDCSGRVNSLSWVDAQNIDFKEAKNNPTTTFEEYLRAHGPGIAFL